jgi:hypothetical protein
MSAEFGMHRDPRDEWPDEDPNTPGTQWTPGKFDIELTTVEGYPGATARMSFVCPSGRHCSLLLAPQPIARAEGRTLYVWGWDGNIDCPTLTPSINCIAQKDGKPTGGCGWHGFINAGRMR